MTKEQIYRTFYRMPTLETDRLLLRPLREEDAEDMFDYAKRPSVTRFLRWSPHESLSFTRQYLNYIEKRYAVGDFYDWAVVEKASGRMIGTCGFAEIRIPDGTGQIGYVFHPDFHGKGLAHEAALEVMRFGFETLSMHRIEARFMEGNQASLRLMERLGMRFEGYARDAMFIKGKHCTIGVCAMLREEFQNLGEKE